MSLFLSSATESNFSTADDAKHKYMGGSQRASDCKTSPTQKESANEMPEASTSLQKLQIEMTTTDREVFGRQLLTENSALERSRQAPLYRSESGHTPAIVNKVLRAESSAWRVGLMRRQRAATFLHEA